MKYVIAAALVLILFTLFSTKEADMQRLNGSDTILAFGDSLTYGFGTSAEESYPSQLQRLSSLPVINAGINGETSSEALRRLPSLLSDPSIKLMLLCSGGNDLLQKKPLAQIKSNLKSMIAMAKERGIDVLLISVPDFSLFGLSPLDLYDEVAKEEEVPLVSGLLADVLGDPALKSDQIHPNAKGYKVMAEEIHKALKAYGWLP
jgi:lysophospholipase L1-like esterase